MTVFIHYFIFGLFKDFNSGSLTPGGGEGIQHMDILLSCLFAWEVVHNIH